MRCRSIYMGRNGADDQCNALWLECSTLWRATNCGCYCQLVFVSMGPLICITNRCRRREAAAVAHSELEVHQNSITRGLVGPGPDRTVSGRAGPGFYLNAKLIKFLWVCTRSNEHADCATWLPNCQQKLQLTRRQKAQSGEHLQIYQNKKRGTKNATKVVCHKQKTISNCFASLRHGRGQKLCPIADDVFLHFFFFLAALALANATGYHTQYFHSILRDQNHITCLSK